MFDKRTLRQIIDSISEKAKADGVPPAVAGELLVDVHVAENAARDALPVLCAAP